MKSLKLIILLILTILFTSCEKSGPEPTPDPEPHLFNYKEYSLDSLSGLIIDTEIMIEDFSSSDDCKDCHLPQYTEWSSSFHAHSFDDPVFMSMWTSEKEHRP